MPKLFRRGVGLVVAALLAVGCSGSPKPVAPRAAIGPRVVDATLHDVGLDPDALDRSADPCQDFYKYACGGWLARQDVPGDRARFGRTAGAIYERNRVELRKLFENPAGAPGGERLSAYYGACMDERSVESLGLEPIRALLDGVDAVTDRTSLARYVAELHAHDIWPLFYLTDAQDLRDATLVIAELDQDGIGLPHRGYYVTTDDRSRKVRTSYRAHVARMLRLGGLAPEAALHAADDTLAIETRLARLFKNAVQRRDVKGMYNRIDRVGLQRIAPAFAWDDYFKSVGRPDVANVSVTSAAYFAGVGRIVASTPPAAMRNYLRWHVLRATAPLLTNALAKEQFSMQPALTGQATQAPRWERCVGATESALGELAARAYIAHAFDARSKRDAAALVAALRGAFVDELQGVTWLDDAARARATAKLRAMGELIGYPEKWNEPDFDVDPHAFATNALNARASRMREKLGRIGSPSDPSAWPVSPLAVDAFYQEGSNRVIFPAGVLQPPLFATTSTAAVNYGAIGMLIGHELTHAFDTRGSLLDERGNATAWWSADVRARFDKRAACVAEHYATYEPLPGVRVNGWLTLAENIADIGGARLAFRAYRGARRGAEVVTRADGFSEDQQFFLSMGQTWCDKMTDEAVRSLVDNDEHAPPSVRINGALSALPEFAETFACAPGTPMRPKNACSVW